MEYQGLATGKERGDDLKGRVFCCCSNQCKQSALDMGQKCILLSLVKAMNFIDKEDCSCLLCLHLFRFVDNSANILYPGKNG